MGLFMVQGTCESWQSCMRSTARSNCRSHVPHSLTKQPPTHQVVGFRDGGNGEMKAFDNIRGSFSAPLEDLQH